MSDEPAAPPPPPFTTPPAPPAPVPDTNRTILLVLAYLPALGLVPLLTEKNDKEVLWHAKNGLVLFAAWVLFFMFDVLVLAALSVFGCLYSVVTAAMNLLYLILIVLGIVKALSGQRLVIPFLSGLADKF